MRPSLPHPWPGSQEEVSCHWPVLARASWSAEKAGTSDRALAISLGVNDNFLWVCSLQPCSDPFRPSPSSHSQGGP